MRDIHIYIYMYIALRAELWRAHRLSARPPPRLSPLCTPNLPINIIPTKIALLKLSGKSPMDMRIPSL